MFLTSRPSNTLPPRSLTTQLLSEAYSMGLFTKLAAGNAIDLSIATVFQPHFWVYSVETLNPEMYVPALMLLTAITVDKKGGRSLDMVKSPLAEWLRSDDGICSMSMALYSIAEDDGYRKTSASCVAAATRLADHYRELEAQVKDEDDDEDEDEDEDDEEDQDD